MKITLTSASGNLLSSDNFEKITLMTENGQITILPGHEPLLSVVRPGVLSLVYSLDGEKKSEEFVTGGGVVTISPDDVTIVIDSLDSADSLGDIAEIEKKKQEAAKILADYKSENKTDKSAKELMQLEYEYLKYAAMQELVKNSSLRSSNSRY